MKKFFAVLLALAAIAIASPSFASEENPCGNHGNHCCTDDGGESYDSVEATCGSFCSSTAEAVSVAVSECQANCSVTLAETVANAVASATAACAQTCSTPICLKWKIRYSNGVPVARVCKKTTEQPITTP